MAERRSWTEIRTELLADPAVRAGYEAEDRAPRLGETVRRARQERQWSQTELARRASVSRAAVSRVESGGGFQSTVLERISRALDAELLVELRPRSRPAAVPA
jgi:ribosome-binding protein aMBF1 (putative translation factor)